MTAPSATCTAVVPKPLTRTGPLRVASCLAPHLSWWYRFLASCLGDCVGRTSEFIEDASYEQLGDVDIVFVCSLAYIEHPAIYRQFEPLAAPVLAGTRYGSRPVYYSDVIVRHDSRLRSFADIRGRTWAFNEKLSQSGYGITRYHLARLGETRGYFGQLIEAGRHERAIAAIDKDSEGRSCLARAQVERFVQVDEETYDPIRTMNAFATAIGLSVLK